jgi:integrase
MPHRRVRATSNLPQGFVLHSLRHTFLTRLGLAGVDAFTIMKLAGHGSVVVSQRYVHPTPQAMEHAVARLDAMNSRALEAGSRSEDRHEVATVSATSTAKLLVSH